MNPHAMDGGMWVDRIVDDLDEFADIPDDVLAARLLTRGRCLDASTLAEPPDPPPGEASPDRWLAAWLCAGCPVRRECLEVELRDAGADTAGVWGGLADGDRRALVARWQAHPSRSAYDDSGTDDDNDWPNGGTR